MPALQQGAFDIALIQGAGCTRCRGTSAMPCNYAFQSIEVARYHRRRYHSCAHVMADTLFKEVRYTRDTPNPLKGMGF